MNEVTRHFCWHQNFVPWGLSAPALGLYTCIKSWKKMYKMYKIRLQRDLFWNLQQMTEVTRCSCWHQNFVPKGLSAAALRTIYMYKIMKKKKKKKYMKSDFKEIFLKLVANDGSDKRFLLTSKFCSLGLSAPDLQLSPFIKSWKDVYKVRD